MRLITWNINSVRRRIDQLARLVEMTQPDVVCLQETKVDDPLFPREAVAEMGLVHQAIHGQKAYNGVAILSAVPFEDSGTRSWCGKDDRRHIWVTLPGVGELHNFYIPAGGDVPDPAENPKFAHKLSMLDDLADWSAGLTPAPRIAVGDFNVAPLETDVWSHKQLRNVVSHTEPEITRLLRWQAAGKWVDAMRHFHPPQEKLFTWWSYRARDWRASNRGRRLDHVWTDDSLVQRYRAMQLIDIARDWDAPSDHIPVLLELTDL